MRQPILKSLILTSILLCSSLVSAQEETNPDYQLDMQDPDYCVPFPSCAQVSIQLNSDTQEQQSEWSKLWNELTKEMKEKVQELSPQSK